MTKTKDRPAVTDQIDPDKQTKPLTPEDFAVDPADAPLPMPPDAGVPSKPAAAVPSPYSLAISYVIGNGRHECQVMDCPFEEIETVDQFMAVINAISQANRGMRVTPLFMKVLRK